MMSNRYWHNYHSQPDGTQEIETDPTLTNYINRKLHLKQDEVTSFVDGICMSHQGQPAMFFTNFAGEEFLRAGYDNRDVRVNVYGNRGRARTERETSYASVYFDDDLIGPQFFQNIFDGRYLSEREGSELEHASDTMKRKKEQFINKQEIICRIVERIWYYLEQNINDCIVLYIGDRETVELSMDLLREIYRFIPQQLRATIGFVTNSSPVDVTMLLEKVPVSIITTMIPGSQWSGMNSRIHYLDINELEDGDEERITQLLQMYQMCQENPALFEAKLAYAEVISGVSFKRMQDIVDMMLHQGLSFWWEDESVETVTDLNKLCSKNEKYISSDSLKSTTKRILDTEISRVVCRRLTKSPLREKVYAFDINNFQKNGALLKIAGVAEVFDTVSDTVAAADKINSKKIRDLEQANDLLEIEISKKQAELMNLKTEFNQKKREITDLNDKIARQVKQFEEEKKQLEQNHNVALNQLKKADKQQLEEVTEKLKCINIKNYKQLVRFYNRILEFQLDTDNFSQVKIIKNIEFEDKQTDFNEFPIRRESIYASKDKQHNASLKTRSGKENKAQKLEEKKETNFMINTAESISGDFNIKKVSYRNHSVNVNEDINIDFDSQLIYEDELFNNTEDAGEFSKKCENKQPDFGKLISELETIFNKLKQTIADKESQIKEMSKSIQLLGQTVIKAKDSLEGQEQDKEEDSLEIDNYITLIDKIQNKLVMQSETIEEWKEVMKKGDDKVRLAESQKEIKGLRDENEKIVYENETLKEKNKQMKRVQVVSIVVMALCIGLVCVTIVMTCMLFSRLSKVQENLTSMSSHSISEMTDDGFEMVDALKDIQDGMASIKLGLENMQEDVQNLQTDVKSMESHIDNALKELVYKQESESSAYNTENIQNERTGTYNNIDSGTNPIVNDDWNGNVTGTTTSVNDTIFQDQDNGTNSENYPH